MSANDVSGKGPVLRISPVMQLALLFLIMLCMMCVTAALHPLLSGWIKDMRTNYILLSVLQNLLAFCFPVWAVFRLSGSKPMQKLGITSNPGLLPMLLTIMTLAAALPVMNFIIDWNAGIHLSERAKELEQSLREMESNAEKVSQVILSTTTAGGLTVNLLTVALLTGFSEELFFRGALQKIFVSITFNRHLAVWLAAFVFSLMHFQFFGFVPRLLLGAFFGYLYLWNGSIWINATAHAINNGIVVIAQWLMATGAGLPIAENIGAAPDTQWIALPSLILTAFLIWLCSKYCKRAENPKPQIS